MMAQAAQSPIGVGRYRQRNRACIALGFEQHETNDCLFDHHRRHGKRYRTGLGRNDQAQ
jgi:hypothetical protein